MFRIDAPGATPGNLFTEGDPQTGAPATVVSADWLNATQEELCELIEAAGLTLDKNDSTQVLQAVRSLAGGSLSSSSGIGANNVINGDFGVFQRALTAPGGVLTKALGVAATAYAFDRWQSSSDGGGGNGNATLSRVAFTAGQTNVPGAPAWHLRHVQSVGSTVASPFARQKVEDVARFEGTWTFSVWAQAQAPASCSLRITQKFGTGGSGDVVVVTTPITVSTSWARHVVTVALPSVAGKTITADSHVLLEVLFPSGATFTIDLSDVQFERSPNPTAFQRRAQTVEVELCRRYYEKSYAVDKSAADGLAPLGGARAVRVEATSTGAHHFTPVGTRFLVEKRATPTIVWISPSGQQTAAVDVEGVSTAVGATTANDKHATGYPTPITSPVGLAHAHWTADAEL